MAIDNEDLFVVQRPSGDDAGTYKLKGSQLKLLLLITAAAKLTLMVRHCPLFVTVVLHLPLVTGTCLLMVLNTNNTITSTSTFQVVIFKVVAM